ncbi:Low-density lipoprotein (LDL) receptor class A repeat [Trinorchestia longiramus]|nr:Low-density lipoprotein (LDL) receptor class A repeat [Trinorchestia longiramus]
MNCKTCGLEMTNLAILLLFLYFVPSASQTDVQTTNIPTLATTDAAVADDFSNATCVTNATVFNTTETTGNTTDESGKEEGEEGGYGREGRDGDATTVDPTDGVALAFVPATPQVMLVDFMSETLLDTIEIEQRQAEVEKMGEEMIYQSPQTLNMGTPLSEVSVCLWVHFTYLRYTNDFVSIMAPASDSAYGFYFVTLGAFASHVYIQTHACSRNYVYQIKLRRWTHFCLIMGDNVTLFADGALVMTDSSCYHNGTEILTSFDGKLDVGGNRYVGLPIFGKIADIKLFPYLLNKESVAMVHELLEYPGEYKDLIVPTDEYTGGNNFQGDRSPNLFKYKAQVSTISVEELRNPQSDDIWLQITSTLTQKNSQRVCHKLGGHLLDSEKVSIPFITSYTRYIFEESLANYWMMAINGTCVSLSVTPSNIRFVDLGCNLLLRSICSIPKDTNFSLIFNSERYSFKLIERKCAWYSDSNMQVEYSDVNKKLYLLSTLNQKKLAQVADISFEQLVGRLVWDTPETDEETHYSFSICNSSHFSCSDGLCIDLDKTCDFHTDCTGFSDEKLCNYTESRPYYYNRELSGSENGKLQVNLKMSLLRILELNMDEGTVKTELEAVATWRDTRVVFHNIYPNVKTLVPRSDAAFYWQPNIVLSGVVNTDTYSLSMDKEPQDMFITAKSPGQALLFDSQEVLEVKGEDVDIEHRKSNIITLTCEFDLYIYPFDSQTCNLTLTLLGKIKQDAQWNPDLVEYQEYTGGPLQLFTFIHFKRVILDEPGNPILFQLRIARRFGSHILVTFLPCFVLQLIGLSVFAVPLDDLASRLTVSISCLIVMAALFTQISSTLPVSADPKMIDVWMFVHVLLLALVFFAILVLQKLHCSPRRDVDERLQVWFEKMKVWPMNLPRDLRKESVSERANTITAWVSVAIYFAFLVVVFTYIFVSRSQQLASSD